MVILENEWISARLVAERGAQIVSLVSRASGRELLLRRDSGDRTAAIFGDVYDERYSYGFDDCVPTVAPGIYPNGPWSGAVLPDHGDLWSIPWRCEQLDSAHVRCEADGVSLPYHFARAITLESNTMVLEYTIESRAGEPFAFNWTMHPLFAPDEGSPIALAPGLEDVERAPFTFRGERFARMQFTRRLHAGEGWCSLLLPVTGERVRLSFATSHVPYLGIWVTQGAWPVPERGQYAIALEPCLAPGSLADTISSGTAPILLPGERRSWRVELALLTDSSVR